MEVQTDFKTELIELLNMKNGFNMKKSSLHRIGLFISILLILFTLSNCRTAKTQVEKMKEDFKKAEFVKYKHDSISTIEKLKSIEILKEDTWKEFWNIYEVNFTGDSNEDEFEIIKTDEGYKFKGKGTAAIKNNSNSGQNKSIDSESEKQTNNVLINSESEKKDEVKQSSSTINKSKTSTSTGFNWNFTIVIIVAVAVGLYLTYRYIKKT